MKVKILRHKDTKEFIHIRKINNAYQNFTSDLPKIMSERTTLELLKEIYPIEECDFDLF